MSNNRIFKIAFLGWIVALSFLQFNRWKAEYRTEVKQISYKICFDALPSHTKCQSDGCFKIHQMLTYYLMNYVFPEHLLLCQVITSIEGSFIILYKEDQYYDILKAWNSVLQCMFIQAPNPMDIEKFPYHADCEPSWNETKRVWEEVVDKADLRDFQNSLNLNPRS